MLDVLKKLEQNVKGNSLLNLGQHLFTQWSKPNVFSLSLTVISSYTLKWFRFFSFIQTPQHQTDLQHILLLNQDPYLLKLVSTVSSFICWMDYQTGAADSFQVRSVFCVKMIRLLLKILAVLVSDKPQTARYKLVWPVWLKLYSCCNTCPPGGGNA